MVRTRVLLGAVMIAAVVGLVWLDARLAAGPGVGAGGGGLTGAIARGGLIALVFAALAAGGAVELTRLLAAADAKPVGWWMGLVSAGLILTPALAAPGAQWGSEELASLLVLTAGLAGAMALAAGRAPTPESVRSLAATTLGILYLGVLGSFAVRLRATGPAGPWLVLYFVGVVKSTDIGAFFVGKFLGKHKLAPRLSPGKTIEGLAGGIAAATIVAVIAGRLLGGMETWQLVCFGPVMAIVGQGGDLAESLLKRAAGAKDSGSTIPAFGGVLDLLDSPLLAAPFAWALLAR